MKHKHDPQTFRRFVAWWIGSHVLCTLVFFVFHSLCFLVGVMVELLVKDYDVTRYSPVGELVWDMCATIAPTFAVMPTLVSLSLLQLIVSRRTIDILPPWWFRVTSLAYIPVYLVLFIGVFQAAEASTYQGVRSDLTTLFTPMYIMFVWMALVQGACLLREGVLEAVFWALGCVLPLIVLIPFNEGVYIDMGALIFNFYPLLIAYPILLSLVTAGLSYMRWRTADVRKRHID